MNSKDIMKKSTFLGLPIAEVIGIIMMIIPFVISIKFSHTETGYIFGFIPCKSRNKEINIHPSEISTLYAAIFYVSLIVRYDFFRRDNLGSVLISIVQTFLNIWVLSAMLSVVADSDNPKVSALLIAAVVLSWLGIKTIAGYSWALFAIASLNNFLDIDSTMGMTGAVFMVTTVISMICQVSNVSDIRTFMEEFRSPAKTFASSARDEIGMAAEDASERIHRVFDGATGSLRMNDLTRVAAAGEEKPRKKNKEDIE